MWGWSSRYDWFEKLMGFSERSYEQAKAQMTVEVVEGEQMLRSTVTGKSFGCGELELVSLETLRARVAALGPPSEGGKLKLSCEQGDVRRMHPSFPGALFQVTRENKKRTTVASRLYVFCKVASQFNLLEMVGPGVTPEDGVSGYAGDPTQGVFRCFSQYPLFLIFGVLLTKVLLVQLLVVRERSIETILLLFAVKLARLTTISWTAAKIWETCWQKRWALSRDGICGRCETVI
jgi:hypothetical protein